MDEASAIKTEAEALVVQYQAEVDSLDAEVAALVEQERQAAAEAAAAAQAASFKEEERTQESSEDTDDNSGGSTGGSTGGGNSGGSNTGGGTGGGGTTGGGNSGGGNSGGGITSGGSTGGSTGGSAGNGTPNTAALGVAQTQLGVPYVWGGTTPGVGLDCSGLTSYCYSATGYSIGRTTGAQYSSARYVLSLSEAQPGDVLYTGGHVGICASAGGGSYIHAPQPGEVVCYSSWRQFYCALRW